MMPLPPLTLLPLMLLSPLRQIKEVSRFDYRAISSFDDTPPSHMPPLPARYYFAFFAAFLLPLPHLRCCHAAYAFTCRHFQLDMLRFRYARRRDIDEGMRVAAARQRFAAAALRAECEQRVATCQCRHACARRGALLTCCYVCLLMACARSAVADIAVYDTTTLIFTLRCWLLAARAAMPEAAAIAADAAADVSATPIFFVMLIFAILFSMRRFFIIFAMMPACHYAIFDAPLIYYFQRYAMRIVAAQPPFSDTPPLMPLPLAIAGQCLLIRFD